MSSSEGMSLREGLQHLWCLHCKAMQKTNETQVDCWYNPLDDEAPAFCAANEDAITAILLAVAEEVERMPKMTEGDIKDALQQAGYDYSKGYGKGISRMDYEARYLLGHFEADWGNIVTELRKEG